MKRYLGIMAVVAVVCVAGYFAAVSFSGPGTEAPSAKLMSIESYIKQNISELSSEPAVLGGTFYVTGIQVTPGEDGKGTGVVSYEDGHVAFTADFSYEADDFRGVKILRFIVRK